MTDATRDDRAARRDPGPASHMVAADWGTSSLRAALVTADGRVVDRVETADGIMFANGRSFGAIFEGAAGPWLELHPDAPVLACGMIGSRQGWVEAPYVACPASFADLGRHLAWADLDRGGRIGFVPGVTTTQPGGAPDVMRGEETQVFGALTRIGLADGLVVLPGTHSKWARVTAGRIVAFRTFLTGEMFGLLRRHSILGRLMPAEDEDAAVPNSAFEDGCAVSAGAAGSLLHDLFSVRTHGLFGHKPASDLAGYMSGLLIGEEIREATALEDAIPPSVHLIGAPALAALYRRALAVFGIDGEVVAGEASIAGLHAVARARGLI